MNKLIQSYQDSSSLGLSEFKVDAPTPFSLYDVPYFHIPIISSAQLATNTMTIRELETLESFVLKNTKFKELSIKILIQNKSQRDKLEKILIKHDYVKGSTFCVNFWNKPKPLILPENVSLKTGYFFDKSTYKDFDYIQRSVFKVDSSFQAKIRKLTRDMNVNPTLVNIYNTKGNPIASGGVTILNDTGWLFGGAVMPRYQGKGLWNTLFAARQTFTEHHGVKQWYLETENPRISSKFEKQFRYSIFTKKIR